VDTGAGAAESVPNAQSQVNSDALDWHRLYPALAGHPVQAARFHRMRNRSDQLATIALGAAETFQESGSHRRITSEAWGDAINGGIVLC
jgi:hypothetical protein